MTATFCVRIISLPPGQESMRMGGVLYWGPSRNLKLDPWPISCNKVPWALGRTAVKTDVLCYFLHSIPKPGGLGDISQVSLTFCDVCVPGGYCSQFSSELSEQLNTNQEHDTTLSKVMDDASDVGIRGLPATPSRGGIDLIVCHGSYPRETSSVNVSMSVPNLLGNKR